MPPASHDDVCDFQTFSKLPFSITNSNPTLFVTHVSGKISGVEGVHEVPGERASISQGAHPR